MFRQALIGLIMGTAPLVHAAGEPPLALVATIPLPGVKGRIDHLDVDVRATACSSPRSGTTRWKYLMSEPTVTRRASRASASHKGWPTCPIRTVCTWRTAVRAASTSLMESRSLR